MYNKFIASTLIAAMLLAGCATSESEEVQEETTTEKSISTEDMFTDRDYDTTYEDYETITLENNNSSTDGEGVSIDGNTITINKEGSYLFSGTLDEGQIVVDVQDSEKVQIVLDNASVSNSSSAALYVKSADKVFVTMTQYSYNHLNATGEFTTTDENNVDGAVFSKSDITFNGDGNLIIESTGNGIVCKDDLKITSGTYEINASSKGLEGKDSVRIAQGNITIQSQTDGIQSDNSLEDGTLEDENKGFIYILDGTFTITSNQDGISASNYILMEDGSISITTNGGNTNASSHQGNDMMFGDFGHDDFNTDYQDDSTVSCKGLKAGTSLIINDGNITLDCADDTLHSNGNIEINGGTINAASGDDGVHADATFTITNGTLTVSNSYEGIEAHIINMNGGTTYVYASDDGFNAASDTSSELNITSGRITVNAGGDGLDSNGSLTMSGGTVYINAPDNGGNGIIDYQTSGEITGGTLIGAGASGMNENFSNASIGCILTNTNTCEAGTTITLKDSKGNVLESYTTEKSFNSILVCSPSITESGTFTIDVGSDSLSIEMSGFLYGSGNGMGGGMDMGQGGQMDQPGGQMQDGNQPDEKPDGQPDGQMGDMGQGGRDFDGF